MFPLLVAAAVAAAPLEAQQSPPATTSRGALTKVGLGLMGVGGAGLGLGIAGLVVMENARFVLTANWPNGPTDVDVPLFTVFRNRYYDALALTVSGFVVGGLALVGSVVCLILDAPKPLQQLTFVPRPGGGAFVFTAEF
ncbi:MAG: hypothetical protein ACOZQL_42440 [Myxococcota bacterium]